MKTPSISAFKDKRALFSRFHQHDFSSTLIPAILLSAIRIRETPLIHIGNQIYLKDRLHEKVIAETIPLIFVRIICHYFSLQPITIFHNYGEVLGEMIFKNSRGYAQLDHLIPEPVRNFSRQAAHRSAVVSIKIQNLVKKNPEKQASII